jgi:hypothetical protein
MRTLILLVVLAAIVACASQQGRGSTGSSQPYFRLDDLGGSAPDSPPSGPVLAVWPDGFVAISASFPSHSSDFRLGRLDPIAAEEVCERFIKDIPPQVAFAADEWKARAIFRPRDSRPAVLERDLPMCFLNMSCSDRLGAAPRVSWERLARDLQQSAGTVSDASAMKRAKDLWR